MIALIGHAVSLFDVGSSTGLFRIGTAKRLFGCAAFSFESGVQSIPFPIQIACAGGGAIFAFPPDIAVVGQRDIGVERVALDRFHRVRIRFVTGPGNHAEIAVLRIDGVEPAILADLHPGDVVADRRDLPALEMGGRNEHGEIRLAARARKRRRDVMFSAFRRFDSENQHVLGQPALFAREIGTDPQRETFLAQQHVAAVTRTDRNDRVVLREMADQAALRIHIEHGMHAAIQFRVRLGAQTLARDRIPFAS